MKQEHYKPWIVDSDASDHMIGDKRVFNTYSPCNEALTIRFADGSLAKVEGIGSVVVSRNITLKFVLYVPNLDCNVLSINKFTQELNYVANFSPHVCEFQDFTLERMICSARSYDGLYHLKVQPYSVRQSHLGVSEPISCQINSCVSVGELKNQSEKLVMMWHYRLGNPSFLYLSKLFPSLFKNKSVISF